MSCEAREDGRTKRKIVIWRGGRKKGRIGEDWERYEKQVDESRGFDVDYFPDMINFPEIITPVKDEEIQSYLQYLLRAIDRHNHQKKRVIGGRLIEFVRIIKLNTKNYHPDFPMAYRPTWLYFTFEARDVPDGATRTYQGRVDLDHEHSDEFIILRDKASSDACESTAAWNDGDVVFRAEDWKRYEKQVEESGGFDVDSFPGMMNIPGILKPVKDQDLEYPLQFLLPAIDRHNQKQKKVGGGRSIEFVRIIKLNSMSYPPNATYPTTCLYYTFDARDVPGGATRTYQARLNLHPEEDSVDFLFFREKASSDV